MYTHAWAAVGSLYHCSGFRQCEQGAVFHTLFVYILRVGDDQQAGSLGNVLASENISGNVQIFHTAIGAASDEYHVNLLVGAVLCQINVLHIVRL